MQINHNNNSHSQQYSHNGASNGGGGSGNKPARIRTVLNEKQLHTLRACYGANPRPDALMKEQLVEMTGLNPRVIRVWFQNKRCKDKKKTILLKQMQEQQKVCRISIPLDFLLLGMKTVVESLLIFFSIYGCFINSKFFYLNIPFQIRTTVPSLKYEIYLRIYFCFQLKFCCHKMLFN